ncbi:hypothetical protein O181_027662 [Austropuccinia psidii MF-1]|uniref:Uncharacterized protein n=1 Tax=Austropuccinia psidii MF-1 TaxID=1389203 RepID=A0A9Q3H1W8_9BASI|nr:hypothetical protein [Austropuccinia psidii MF-1]
MLEFGLNHMAESSIWKVEVGKFPEGIIVYKYCMSGKSFTLPVEWKDQIFHLKLAEAFSYCGAEEHENTSTCPLKVTLNSERQHYQAGSHSIWNLEPKTITRNQGPGNTTNMNVGKSGSGNSFNNNNTNTNMRPWKPR